MPAYELLKTLRLLDLSRVSVLREEAGPSRLTVRRIRIPSPRRNPNKIPTGPQLLCQELAPVTEFELIYNPDGFLIAIYPAPDLPIPEGQTWHFWDLSPYYFEVPFLYGDKDCRQRWENFSAGWLQDQHRLRAYEKWRGIDAASPRRILNGIGQNKPYVYIYFADTTIATPFYPDQHARVLCWDHFDYEVGYDLVVPLFPTVYSPAHFGEDRPYHVAYFYGWEEESVQEGDSVLVMGPGSGLEVALAGKNSKRKVFAAGINPLEVANTRATAKINQVRVRTKVSDNLISPSGKPVFPGPFDVILWNQPGYEAAPKAVPKNLKDFWDFHYGPADLERTVIGLRQLLKSDGKAFLWNQLCDGANPVLSRLRAGGFSVHAQASDRDCLYLVFPAAFSQRPFEESI